MKAGFIYSDRLLSYDFGPQHPLRPLRLRLLYELIDALGLLEAPGVERIEPRPATAAELTAVHDPAYVEAVELLSSGADPFGRQRLIQRFGFASPDNPVFAGMHEAAALAAGGAVMAAEHILAGQVQRAFHPGGGLHHAMPARAAGFCIYNDPACAIARFRAAGWRVLYIDGDAHHGDGVEAIFIEDPGVLTISLHEDGRFLFPGTGFVDDIGRGAGRGYAVNVPLLPRTGDDSWIEAFHRVVPPLARAFRPDVVVSQHGCDAHVWDPLTHLHTTTRALEAFARAVDALSRELCGGRWLALGGGGYDVWRVVPRAWTLVWAAVSSQEVPEEVPAGWLERWQGKAPARLPRSLRDRPDDGADPGAEDPEVAAVNGETARRAVAGCLPIVAAGLLG
ncbi:MAG TPA: acetoin utilization protein AcuC [Bacillota bacterium]